MVHGGDVEGLRDLGEKHPQSRLSDTMKLLSGSKFGHELIMMGGASVFSNSYEVSRILVEEIK